jgi:hypothetical protein
VAGFGTRYLSGYRETGASTKEKKACAGRYRVSGVSDGANLEIQPARAIEPEPYEPVL